MLCRVLNYVAAGGQIVAAQSSTPITNMINNQAPQQLQQQQQQHQHQLEKQSLSAFQNKGQQLESHQLNNKLEPPVAIQQHFVQGPGVDLVALNRRRFEVGHDHSSSASENELRFGELIESKVASVPDRILNRLPDDVNKQLMETLANDITLISGESSPSATTTTQSPTGMLDEDPDGASIERLTKSCLTVHASSARPEQLNVTFHLYTKNNPKIPYILGPSITRFELIKRSPFDSNRPIKWITHGFHTNVDKSEWMIEAKDKILVHENANVILTDWRRGASPALAFYPKAAANAHIVAKMIVKIIRRLRDDIDFSQIHLIGHSLGAHIMGFVGSAFTEEYLHQQQQLLMYKSENSPFWRERASNSGQILKGINQLVGRITACDPALPCFGPTSSAPNGQKPAQYQFQTTIPTQQQTIVTSSSSIQATSVGILEIARDGPNSGDSSLDWTPSMWTHLRPDSAVVVEVMHSNPGVMGYSDPLGDYDFYPNGLERQPGCGNEQDHKSPVNDYSSSLSSSFKYHRRQLMNWNDLLGSIRSSGLRGQPSASISQTLGKFIKPIKDFFHGYTCSHHRSVEYMVESMYYELVPQTRKLDRDFICQMVGYRCNNYENFKKGFCFKCIHELDCRTFTMSTSTKPTSETGFRFDLGTQFQSLSRSTRTLDKFKILQQPTLNNNSYDTNNGSFPILLNRNATKKINNEKKYLSNVISRELTRRVLPSFNPYNQNYIPQQKNQYYFDTRPARDFCLHHYHLHIKYRWFRIRESVLIDGFNLIATLANITQRAPIQFNRFTPQSYTLLLTEPVFLGQIESLFLIGDKIKPTLIEHIEVTYMSNLDSRVRALGSARLCRQSQTGQQLAIQQQQQNVYNYDSNKFTSAMATLFVRCSGLMV